MVTFAHVEPSSSGKWSITDYGSRPTGELRLEGHQCTTMLNAGEYEFLMVEAPDVPPAELKSAIRWKVKDLVDYRIEEATIDVLDIPPPVAATAPRVRPMFAVAARNDLLRGRIRELQEARVPLSVIDIRETAQRNLAALYETEERGLAFLYFGAEAGLLTINFRGELYLARRLDVGVGELAADARDEGGALERVALEVQRTLDHFDRQFRHVAVSKLVIGPTPQPTRLAESLRGHFEMAIEEADLRGVLEFGANAPDAPEQWRLFHHFGAALRQEAGAAA